MSHNRLLSLLIAAVMLSASASLTAGQTTAPQGGMAPQALLGSAFTYQGQLKSTVTGIPITDTCNFQFSLWNAATQGVQIGNSQTVNGVNVASGLFTVNVNGNNEFSANAFTDEARWLEVAVQCSGDANFATLSPRQPITPTPYALALPGLRTQQNAASPNVIGGHRTNSILANVVGGTIGGGGSATFPNTVTDDYGTVNGGQLNRAGDNAGTTSDESLATVGGGGLNTASGEFATVSGGFQNTASGYAATVAGGESNIASGNHSFAAGDRARANHAGAFVWADATASPYASTATNQFAIRASNGVSLAVNAGDVKTIQIGERYRDNALVAWAKIRANGTIQSSADFGVAVVAHTEGPGVYTIGIDDNTLDTATLIPIAIAEVESAPTPPNAADKVRLVMINQTAPSAFKVYITDGNFNLVDNDFVFMATGR